MDKGKASTPKRARSESTSSQPPAKKQKTEAQSVEKIIEDFKKDFAEEKEKLFLKLREKQKKEQGKRTALCPPDTQKSSFRCKRN